MFKIMQFLKNMKINKNIAKLYFLKILGSTDKKIF